HVGLPWDPPANDGGLPILEYRVYRGTSSGGESFLASAGLSLTFTDSSVTNGQTYYYQVTAKNAAGEGPPSNEASATPNPPATPPGAPSGLSATAGDGSVSLSWSAPGSDGGSPITNYKIYRGGSADGETRHDTTGDVLSYTDSPLTNGKTYYYKVTAVNEVGEGPPSNEASATPVSGDTAPSPPRSLSAAAGDTRVALGWLAPSSDGGSPITNYKIYRGTSSNGESLLITVGNVSAYTDTGVTNGVTYYYVVTAVNGIGDSGASGEASATPTAGPTAPDAPQGLHASPGSGRVDLTWSAPGFDGGSPITGYRLYRGTNSNNRSYSVDVGDVLSYPDTGLTNGQRYYYVVTAINAVGEG